MNWVEYTKQKKLQSISSKMPFTNNLSLLHNYTSQLVFLACNTLL